MLDTFPVIRVHLRGRRHLLPGNDTEQRSGEGEDGGGLPVIEVEAERDSEDHPRLHQPHQQGWLRLEEVRHDLSSSSVGLSSTTPSIRSSAGPRSMNAWCA